MTIEDNDSRKVPQGAHSSGAHGRPGAGSANEGAEQRAHGAGAGRPSRSRSAGAQGASRPEGGKAKATRGTARPAASRGASGTGSVPVVAPIDNSRTDANRANAPAPVSARASHARHSAAPARGVQIASEVPNGMRQSTMAPMADETYQPPEGGYVPNGFSDNVKVDGAQSTHYRSFTPRASLGADRRKAVTGDRKKVIATIAAIVIVVGLVFGGFMIYRSLNSSHATVAGVEKIVEIPTGSTTPSIAKILYNNEIIEDQTAFINEVTSRGVSGSLKAGSYRFTTYMDVGEVIDTLVAGSNGDSGKLTVTEGLTIEETAAAVQSATGVSADEFITLAHSADKYVADYPFLAGAYDNSLEGYLYPKTYYIPAGSNADYVIRTLLSQFNTEMNNAGLSYNGNGTYSTAQLVTMASIIEKETSDENARYNVASVLYNRLGQGMKLQVDPTIAYALGSGYDGHALTTDDLKVDSPYNTYTHEGLPPGPICSPSISSIKAAYAPATTDYLYYVTTELDGTLTFASNYDDFLAAKERYKEVFGVSTTTDEAIAAGDGATGDEQ